MRFFFAAGRLGVAAVSGLAGLVSTAWSAMPFDCATPAAFVSSGNNTALFESSQAGGAVTFNAVGGPSGFRYNAIAFNPADNLIYAVSGHSASAPVSVEGHLLAIDATGTATDRGAISGLPAADRNGGFTSGAFDADGNYWIVASASNTGSSGTFFKVNLTTRAATPLVGQTMPISGTDVTFSSGFMWNAITDSSAPAVLQRTDLATGIVTAFTGPAGMPSANYGSAWTYGNGTIVFAVNAGKAYQLAISNPDTATPGISLIDTFTVPASATNDGTSCTGASADVALVKAGPDFVDPAGSIVWTLSVTNAGAGNSSGFTLIDTLPAGITNAASVTPGCTVAANTVTCLGDALPVGASSVITVTGNAPDPFVGCLTNSATITGNEQDPYTDNDTATQTVCATPSADMAVTGTTLPAVVTAGQSVTGTISCTNAGPSPAASATCGISGLPAGATIACTPASPTAVPLAVAAAITCDVAYLAPASGVIGGIIAAGSATADPATANNAAAYSATITASADLFAAGGPAIEATTGMPITVVTSCSNAGPSTAADATCTVSGGPPGTVTSCVPDGSQSALPITGAITCSSTLTPPDATSIILTTTAASTTGDPTPANNTATTSISPGQVSASPDHAVTPYNTPVTTNVLANDVASGASLDPASLTWTQAAHGAVACDGTGTCTETPASGFVGDDAYSYQVCDSSSLPRCASASVFVAVGPAALADSAETSGQGSISGNVSTNDIYTAGSVFSIVASTAHGTAVMDPSGTFSYSPAEGFAGTDSLTYSVCAPAPDSALCASATVSIRVTLPAPTLAPTPVPLNTSWALVLLGLALLGGARVVVARSG